MRSLYKLSAFSVLLSYLAFAGCIIPVQTDEEAKEQAASIERVEVELGGIAEASISMNDNLYFIFDGSGSMDESGSDRNFNRKIEGAKWAVGEFLKTIPEATNLGLYVFDGNHNGEVVPLAPNNRGQILAAVQAIKAKGGTPLADGIVFGVDRLVGQYKKQLGYGSYRLVVVTDGQANGLPEAAQHALKFGIPIYTIGFDIEGDHPLRLWSVSYKAAESAEELRQALEEATAELPTFDPSTFSEVVEN